MSYALIKVGSFLFVFAAIVLACQGIGSLIFGGDFNMLAHHGFEQFLFYSIFILLVIYFQKRVERRSFVSLGLRPYPGWIGTVLKGWAVGILAYVLCHIVMAAFGIVRFEVASWSKLAMRVPVALLTACAAFGVAATEDILFRGYFFQTLLRGIPKWPAIIITGILFGFFHKLNAVSDFWTHAYDAMLFGGVFCLHVLLCITFLKSKTLFLPIGIHAGLVYAKVAIKKMKIMYVVQDGSWFFGLGGDARRGLLGWALFLGGILVLRWLITDREKKAITQ